MKSQIDGLTKLVETVEEHTREAEKERILAILTLLSARASNEGSKFDRYTIDAIKLMIDSNRHRSMLAMKAMMHNIK